MIKIDIDEIREREMQILDFFDSLCTQYNLQYSIAGGTLLGAIRHKGYIPWDDDIDVFMYRNEYERLLDILRENTFMFKPLIPFVNGNYNTFLKIIDPSTVAVQTDYETNIPGLGIWIDILPLDSIPDNEKEKSNLFRRKKFWHRIRNAGLYKKPKTVQQLPFWLLSKVYCPAKAAEKMNRICRKYENTITKKIGLLVYESNNSFIYERSKLDAYERIPFENREYNAYKEYNYVLTESYGDYMKLPPIEEQIGKHFIDAWKKE